MYGTEVFSLSFRDVFIDVESEDEEVPEFSVFRKAVDQIRSKRDSLLIKTLYLTAGRVSELITKVTPWEIEHRMTKPYGVFLEWKLNEFKGERLLLLKMAVAKRRKKKKRKGKTVSVLVYKTIALPTNPKFEPWTVDLLKHIVKSGNLTFSLTRQRIWQIVKQCLTHLDTHIHPHSFRHYRISHLVQVYDFNAYNITAYSGWTFKTSFGKMGMGSGQLDIYLHLSWKNYFPKLLKQVE